jgi:cytochrome P450
MAGSTEAKGSTKPLPPGSLGLPWLGESLAIASNNHKFYKDRFAKYGPIFKTRLFGINFIVFSGPEAMHRFATDPAIERGGTDPLSVKQIFVKSLALIDGPEHRARKAVMLKGVQHRDSIERWLPRMQRIMSMTIAKWEKDGRGTVLPDLRVMSARLSGALFTGDESEAHIDELNEILGWMREAFQTAPIPIPGTKYGKAMKGRKRLQQLIIEAIDRHRGGTYDDILTIMMAEAKEKGIPEQSLRGDLLHLLFAGQGGYFVPLTLLTMTLGQQPEMMERARQEVFAIAPDGPVTMEQMDKLEYLERLAKELRRFFAMNSATFFGKVIKPFEVGGYQIPVGWGAIGALHITMRSPEVFDDPDRFDPDRFTPDKIAARRPGSYVPHGDGERSGHKCPAEDIVAVAVKLYLVLMLRRHRWEVPPQDLTLTNELFPLPTSGLEIQLQPHGARAENLPRAAEGVVRR